MAEDVKTLRDSIAMLAGEKTWCEDTLVAADIIVRRVVADMIEREEQQAPITDILTNAALQAAEDRGWNKAIDEVHTTLADLEYGADVLNRVASLRRTERGEG